MIHWLWGCNIRIMTCLFLIPGHHLSPLIWSIDMQHEPGYVCACLRSNLMTQIFRGKIGNTSVWLSECKNDKSHDMTHTLPVSNLVSIGTVSARNTISLSTPAYRASTVKRCVRPYCRLLTRSPGKRTTEILRTVLALHMYRMHPNITIVLNVATIDGW